MEKLPEPFVPKNSREGCVLPSVNGDGLVVFVGFGPISSNP